jgi:hypothetical protein
MPDIFYKEHCTQTVGSLYICGTSISLYSVVPLYRITFGAKEELTAASKTSIEHRISTAHKIDHHDCVSYSWSSHSAQAKEDHMCS